jgi:hypothetical protein
MIAFVAVTYLATYGGGAALSQLAGLRLRTGAERFGVACALGSVVLSWVGYVAVVAALPWLPAVGCWACVALACWVIVRSRLRRRETKPLPRRDWLILVGAMAIGLLFAGGMQWGQVRYLADGSMMGRLIWPDTLYRNAVMARLLECSGAPDWPWLAGVPMKGMSLLRFTAMIPSLKALHLPSTCYQTASLWIGLYGIPVAALALFAFFRALGAAVRTCSLAVLLTSFLGNPRWLLTDRFAHSPGLHWAGGDVFAISVPVLFAMLALIVLTVRERKHGALWLAAFMVVSGMGHAPWMGLPLYPGLALWLVVSLVRKEQVRSAVVLSVSALLGYVVLKVLMGSGTGGGAPLLEGIGPSPTIRALSWAFPFLGEPLQPLLSNLGPTNLMKMVKFASVYLVAFWVYLVGSMWVRMVLMPNAFRFRREWLRSAEGTLLCCVTVAAVLLTSVVNFNKIAFQGAQYDALRLLWIPLLLANLGVAALAVLHGHWLRRGWGVLVVLLFVYYGSWENTQLVLWSRTSLPYSIIRSSDMAALAYLDQHVAQGDVVAINPRAQVPGEGVVGGDGSTQITHRWGYVSGLLGARLYLDNEDMARKFGQGPQWDARLRDFQQAMKSASALTTFARSHRIRWIMLQGTDKLPDGSNSKEVFRDGDVRVYSIAS